jgi:hypothetical protein
MESCGDGGTWPATRLELFNGVLGYLAICRGRAGADEHHWIIEKLERRVEGRETSRACGITRERDGASAGAWGDGGEVTQSQIEIREGVSKV